jgi:hypothetical protein
MLEREMEGDESSLIDLNKYSERLTAEYNEKVEFQVKSLAYYCTLLVIMDCCSVAYVSTCCYINTVECPVASGPAVLSNLQGMQFQVFFTASAADHSSAELADYTTALNT